MAPEIVPLGEVPRAAILRLLDTCLGATAIQRTEAFWRWKHERNPFGPSPGLVALDGGEPVALRAFLRWRWGMGGRTAEAVRAVDTATHPSWRRQGLFRRLTLELVDRVRADGAAFVFNTPNPRSRAGYLAMGWKDMGRVPLMVRLRRPGRVLRAVLPGRTGPPENPAGPTTDPADPGLLRPVRELLEDPTLPAFLAAREPLGARLETPRTPAYLRWRYAEAPGLRYGALWPLDGGSDPVSGAALVVRMRPRRSLRELTLSEILVSGAPRSGEIAAELIGRALELTEPDHAAAVAPPGSPERQILRRAGFAPAPFGPRLTVRPFTPLEPDPGERESWRLSVGDLELF